MAYLHLNMVSLWFYSHTPEADASDQNYDLIHVVLLHLYVLLINRKILLYIDLDNFEIFQKVMAFQKMNTKD